MPVQQWLRGPLRDLAGDALLSGAADRGLLRREVVQDWLAGIVVLAGLWFFLSADLTEMVSQITRPG